MPSKEVKPELNLDEKKLQLAIHLNNAARQFSAFADILSKAVTEVPIDESTVDRLTELINVAAKPSRKRKLIALDAGEDGRKKKREKKVKDPNAPKGPASAYILFQNDIRAAYKKEHPDMTNKDLLKLIGEQWKTLPEDKKDYYRDQHGRAKKKHEVDLAAYNSQNPELSPPEPMENGKRKKQKGEASDPFVTKEVVKAVSKSTKKLVAPKPAKEAPKSREVVESSDSEEDGSEVEDSEGESEPLQTPAKAASEEQESESELEEASSSEEEDPSPPPPPKKSRK